MNLYNESTLQPQGPLTSELVSALNPSSSRGVWMLTFVLSLLLALNYVRTSYRYYHTDRNGLSSDVKVAELPPVYPSFIPFLGSLVSFAWDNRKFIRRATSYVGAARISILPNYQIYLFQDRETIKRIFKNPNVGSPIPVYTFAIQRFFGMPERTVQVYRADNSGSGIKPHAESNVPANGRSFHATHKGLLQGLTGPGLGPNSRRYIESFSKRLQVYDNGRIPTQSSSTDGWVQVDDMFHFIQHTSGTAMIEAHFGPTLLRLSPGYMDDLWKLDAGIPWFSRQIPRFLVPEPFRARDRMIKNLTDWYSYAREHFDPSAMDEDGDGDPVWGSSLSRFRQETLPTVKEHDDRAIASLDVGHSWGSTSNVVATTFMAAYHIITDAALLSRVRSSLSKTLGTDQIRNDNNPNNDKPISEVLDPKLLYSDALLCSIYAEILRLHGMAHFLVSAPERTDLQVGRWLFPRGSIGVLNSGLAHMDAGFWNTRDGLHPVTDFWPDRFIVDPRDAASGPVNPAVRDTPYSRPKGAVYASDDEPYFCMDGTEGSWFPYGGGAGICLGRFLAKNAILASLAYLLMDFDIEPQVESLVVNPWRYGLGVNQPKYATPFRIRKRAV